jgi:hypothetical protein
VPGVSDPPGHTNQVVQPSEFDYGALEPALAADARAIANRIRGRLKQGYLGWKARWCNFAR